MNKKLKERISVLEAESVTFQNTINILKEMFAIKSERDVPMGYVSKRLEALEKYLGVEYKKEFIMKKKPHYKKKK